MRKKERMKGTDLLELSITERDTDLPSGIDGEMEERSIHLFSPVESDIVLEGLDRQRLAIEPDLHILGRNTRNVINTLR